VPHLERALKLRQAHLGLDHPDTLATMNSLANAYGCLDRHREAIALMERRLESGKATLGPDHPETLAFMADLAWYYQWAGQWDLSVPLWEQLLDKRRTLHGPTHPATLGAMHKLAANYTDMGRFKDAMALHAKVLDGLDATYGPKHASTGLLREWFAITCQRVGELDRADQLLRDDLEITMKREDSLMRRNSGGDATRLPAFRLHHPAAKGFQAGQWMRIVGG
jgi:tetratricopeptide (TPR) repeat protein